MSVESLPDRRRSINQRRADSLLAPVIDLNTKTTLEWARMVDARAERKAWDQLDTLTAGYGFQYTVTRDGLSRWVGDVRRDAALRKRVSAPSRVECVEMLVAWLEGQS